MLLMTLLLVMGSAEIAQERATVQEREEIVASACRYDIEVRAADERRAGAGRNGYSASRTPDLELVVTAPEHCIDDRLELWVTTPGGHVYQSLKVAPPSRDEIERHRGREWRPRVERASVLFPVKGTLITMSGLYGRWKVEPHMGRDKQPCGRAAWFAIRP